MLKFRWICSRGNWVMWVLSWWGLVTPKFSTPPSGKTVRETWKSFRGARTWSRSSITMPSLVGLGFHPPPGRPKTLSFLWPPYAIEQAIIFFALCFLLLSSFFLSFLPCLISAIADWMSTILHTWCGLSANLDAGWNVLHVWNVLHTARWKYRMQKVAKNSPSGHHCTTFSGYIFPTKARIDNCKNLLNSNILPTCPHSMVNFG